MSRFWTLYVVWVDTKLQMTSDDPIEDVVGDEWFRELNERAKSRNFIFHVSASRKKLHNHRPDRFSRILLSNPGCKEARKFVGKERSFRERRRQKICLLSSKNSNELRNFQALALGIHSPILYLRSSQV